MREEFVNLKLLPCKCLYGPHAGKIFLCHGIERRILLADVFVDGAETVFHADGNECGDEHGNCRYDCKRCMEPVHTEKNNACVEDDLNN